MIETILIWIIGVFFCYQFVGFLLWIIPFDTGVGYYGCGFENYSFWFIFFWLPMIFSERLQEALSK